MGGLHILAVCTANICRSPATATLLRRGLAPLPVQVAVSSAGIAAQDGRPVCDLSAALVGELTSGDASREAAPDALARHESRRLRRDDVARADLILALDRSHRSAIAQLHPASRPYTFTLRQAAGAAATVAEALRVGSVPDGAPPLPSDAAGRVTWWIAELDAARAHLPASISRGTGALVFDALDVPDPHAVGYHYHPVAVGLIEAAVDALLESLALVLESGAAAGNG